MPSRPQIPDAWIPLTGLLDAGLEAMLAEFRTELEKTEFTDVRPTHGCVFRFVRDEGMRPSRLAELANMTKQSVGEIVADLADRGYVERLPDPADRRAKLICLTDKGRRAQRTGFRLIAEVERRWVERYGAERIAALRDVLEEIVAAEVPDAVPELSRDGRHADIA
jgi:DNA-binding MarR family transcriptional regulator